MKLLRPESGHSAAAATGTLPEVDRLTTTGFASLLDRAIAVVCCAVLAWSFIEGRNALQHVDRIWLALIGGSIVAAAVLMPFYAWSRRGVRALAGIYAVIVLVGHVTWPYAWTDARAAASPPTLTLLLGLGVICMGIALSSAVAVLYAVVSAVAYVAVSLTPSGGSLRPVDAVQGALAFVVQPLLVWLILQFVRQAVASFDEHLAQRRDESTETAVDRALSDERLRLDAIIHDEVLTTLVAAARGSDRDQKVAELASHALATLQREASGDPMDAPVSADQFVRLIKDVSTSVCPTAEVNAEIPAASLTIEPAVVRELLRATREAVLNAERHAQASSVQVDVWVAATLRRLQVRIVVADDGVGFDANAVLPSRLGLRLAVIGRLEALGGRAAVSSVPGRGTDVRLMWVGERSQPQAGGPHTRRRVWQHPIFARVHPRPLALLSSALVALNVLIAGLDRTAFAQPWLVAVASVLFGVASVIGVYCLVLPPAGPLRGWLMSGLVVSGTGLALAALGPRAWAPDALWFVAPASLLALVVLASGEAVPAWLAAATYGVAVVIAASLGGQPPERVVSVAAAPLFWLTVLTLFFWWLDSLQAQVDQAETAVEEAARLDASTVSKLMFREVWLSELREVVAPALAKLAGQVEPVTDEDRRRFLLLEGSLRDGLMAGNLNSPALSAAIMDARARGVSVTLVDNRGSNLPAAARKSALRRLEAMVRAAEGGRVVARTAPEGYGEAVTILQVPSGREAKLTVIGENGSVSTGVPLPAAD